MHHQQKAALHVVDVDLGSFNFFCHLTDIAPLPLGIVLTTRASYLYYQHIGLWSPFYPGEGRRLVLDVLVVLFVVFVDGILTWQRQWQPLLAFPPTVQVFPYVQQEQGRYSQASCLLLLSHSFFPTTTIATARGRQQGTHCCVRQRQLLVTQQRLLLRLRIFLVFHLQPR